MFRRFLLPAMMLLVVSWSLPTFGQAPINLKSTSWQFSGKGVSVAQFDGRDAIKISNGMAVLHGHDLQNGLIEFDVYTSGLRSFVYLLFRGQSESEYEDFYIRPHKSDLPDALQYAPVFQRRSAWQLYHGGEGTASEALPARQWVRVKIELLGPKAMFWVGDKPQPSMVIERLGRAPAPGWLAFRGFVPANSNAPFAAYFSNLRVTPYEGDAAQAAPPVAHAAQTEFVNRWRVSPAFVPEPDAGLNLPQRLQLNEWSVLDAQSNGVVEFLRHRAIPDGARRWAVAADIELQAPADQTCTLSFGFSDELTLLLNDQLWVYQDQSFRFDQPRRQGVMHPDMLVAYLPLNRGKNRVRAIVADRFGGWGLSARLLNCDGVQVTP